MAPTLATLIEALSEFDEIERDVFLRKYTDGVGSRTWFVVFEGRKYDLKAVWAAAHRPPKSIRDYHPRAVAGELSSDEYAQVGIKVAHARDAKRYQEGQRRTRLIESIERDPQVAVDARRKHGTKCMACGFEFAKVYGPISKNFIECHHTRPLAQTGPVLQHLKYIVVLCANCHRMVHKNDPPLSVRRLKSIIAIQVGTR